MVQTQISRVIHILRSRGKANPKIEKIILFGSRARSDFHSKSDYDIAVQAPRMEYREWSKWLVALHDDIPTLNELDILRLDNLDNEALKQKITVEGKIVYEKNV